MLQEEDLKMIKTKKKPGNEHPMSTHEHQSDISDTPSTVVSLRGG